MRLPTGTLVSYSKHLNSLFPLQVPNMTLETLFRVPVYFRIQSEYTTKYNRLQKKIKSDRKKDQTVCVPTCHLAFLHLSTIVSGVTRKRFNMNQMNGSEHRSTVMRHRGSFFTPLLTLRYSIDSRRLGLYMSQP